VRTKHGRRRRANITGSPESVGTGADGKYYYTAECKVSKIPAEPGAET